MPTSVALAIVDGLLRVVPQLMKDALILMCVGFVKGLNISLVKV